MRLAQQVATLGTGGSAANSGTTGGNEYGILNLFMSGVARCQLYAYAGGGGVNSYVLDGMSFGQTSAAAGQVVVAPVSAATKGLIVKGFTSQSANLQEWQNSSGANLTFIDSSGNLTLNAQTDLRFADSDSSNWVALQAPATVSTNVTWTLPSADGSAYKMLQTDGAGTLSWSSTIQGDVQLLNAQVGTTYTLALADAGKLITLNNGSPISVTVPLNSSIAFPTGTHIDFAQLGAGQVTIAGAVGVTVRSTPGSKLRTQYSGASIIKIDTDTWMLFGDISA